MLYTHYSEIKITDVLMLQLDFLTSESWQCRAGAVGRTPAGTNRNTMNQLANPPIPHLIMNLFEKRPLIHRLALKIEIQSYVYAVSIGSPICLLLGYRLWILLIACENILPYQLNQKKIHILPQITQLKTVLPPPRPCSATLILSDGGVQILPQIHDQVHATLWIWRPWDEECRMPSGKLCPAWMAEHILLIRSHHAAT